MPEKERAAARAAVERYELGFETAGLGAWDWDLTTNVMVPYGRLLEILGLTQAEYGFVALERAVHPDDRERVIAFMDEQAGRPGAGWSITHRIRRASDGAWRCTVTTGKNVADEDGRVTRMVGVVDDVTELRELREREEQFTFHLRDTLNQELAVASSHLSLARRTDGAPPELLALLGDVASQLQVTQQRMRHLVDRLKRGFGDPGATLGSVVLDVLADVERQVGDGVTVRCSLASSASTRIGPTAGQLVQRVLVEGTQCAFEAAEVTDVHVDAAVIGECVRATVEMDTDRLLEGVLLLREEVEGAGGALDAGPGRAHLCVPLHAEAGSYDLAGS